LERPKRRIASQEHAQQAIRAGFRQGIDSQLRVVALVSPGMLVLGPVARYNQYGRRRQAVDEPIEQGPGFRIRPVKVVEEQQEWLPTTLAQEETLDGIEDLATPLRGIERLPVWVCAEHIEEAEERRSRRLQ